VVSDAVRRRLALTASVSGAMMVSLDGTVLLVAQPSLLRSMHASVAEVQWTSTAYLLTVAALLVVGGRLGDRWGHARLLLVGALGFGASSAAIAFAPAIGWVIVWRGLQGLFGALLQPATLALLRLSFPSDKLSRPVAIRTSGIGIAGALGPLLGGVVVAQFGWRAVFVFNVPIAVFIAVAALVVQATAHPQATAEPAARPRLDLLGSALMAGSLALLVYALTSVPTSGWAAPSTVLKLVGAAVLGGLLVLRERRVAEPLLPPAVARSGPVMASMALLLVITAGLFGSLFVASIQLQQVQGLDALASGVRVLPLTVLMVFGAPLVGFGLRRLGPRRTALAGALFVVLGIAGLARFGPYGLAFASLGAGFAISMVTATGTVVGDAPPEHAGVVGGLKQTAMNIGPTLGIATAATIMTVGSAVGALWTLAAITLLSLLPAALLPGRPAPAEEEPTGKASGVRG